MSEQNTNSTRGGIGLCSLVFLVFLTLKLLQVGLVADWSWWWVTSPLWIPICTLVVVLVVILCVVGIVSAFER